MQNNWTDVKRNYLALVHGILKNKKGTIKNYLKETKTLYVYNSKEKTKDYAITEYEVINEYNNISLLSINILTGKKNQIRVALSSINHPILGDRKYGKKDGMRNLCLHANRLEFIHPVTKKVIILDSKVPKYMEKKDN